MILLFENDSKSGDRASGSSGLPRQGKDLPNTAYYILIVRQEEEAPMLTKIFVRSAFGVAALLLIFHAATFLRFTIDDAFITFTYTKNLIEGKGLVFAAGQHVEATSSMLWAILLLPFEAIFKEGAVIGSKVLGMLCVLSTAIVGSLLVRELSGSNRNPSLACLLFSFLLAGASPFVVWAVYGMENGLVALILTASVLLFLRECRNGHGAASAFVIFLLETVRPEGFIYLPAFAGFRLLFVKGSDGRAPIKCGSPFLAPA